MLTVGGYCSRVLTGADLVVAPVVGRGGRQTMGMAVALGVWPCTEVVSVPNDVVPSKNCTLATWGQGRSCRHDWYVVLW